MSNQINNIISYAPSCPISVDLPSARTIGNTDLFCLGHYDGCTDIILPFTATVLGDYVIYLTTKYGTVKYEVTLTESGAITIPSEEIPDGKLEIVIFSPNLCQMTFEISYENTNCTNGGEVTQTFGGFFLTGEDEIDIESCRVTIDSIYQNCT